MGKLEEWFFSNKLPDKAIVDSKTGKIISGSDFYERKMQILESIDQILKELESIGVYVKNIDEFPDFDEIVGREDLKKVVMASVVNGKQWLRKDVADSAKSVFLYGQPGTGKTHFVRAAGKELAKRVGKENVVYLEVANIESPYIGETSSRLKKLAETVKKLRKAGKEVIVEMDEVDRLAPSRAMIGSSGKRDTTNALLTATTDMQKAGAYIFAMTNDPNMVDKAFLDRFSVKREVTTPSYEELKVFLDSAILDPNIKSSIDIDSLARIMAENKCSFRDAKSLLNYMNVEMNFGKNPSEAAQDALNQVLKSKQDQDKSFLGSNS